MRELEEELKKTSAGRKFLEEVEPEKQTDKMIEFAKEQCEIFPEDSYMGKYLRETLKMLQAEPCEDAISRQAVLNIINGFGYYGIFERLAREVKALPLVTPTLKKGKWIKSNIGGAKVCSICQAHMGLSNFKYCPSCGAEMESKE